MKLAPSAYPRANRRRNQTGAALLLLLMVVLLATASAFIAGPIAVRRAADVNDKTEEALAKAKTALIAYSSSHPTLPGKLPCPEDLSLIGTPNEGSAASSCSNSSGRIGRLPWRTLELDKDFADGNGDKLWYVLSNKYNSAPINSDTQPTLTLDNLEDEVVAIVFSPGVALQGQNRSQTPPGRSDYLDQDNANSDQDYISHQDGSTANTFNDKLLAVTRDELFRAVERRVANEVLFALLFEYCGQDNIAPDNTCRTPGAGNEYFPYPAPITDTDCLGTSKIPENKCLGNSSLTAGRIPAEPSLAWQWSTNSVLRRYISNVPKTWFQRNGWREQVFYAVSPACTVSSPHCATGSLTIQAPPTGATLSNRKIVVVVSGRAIRVSGELQDRHNSSAKTLPGNYLEGANSSLFDQTFQRSSTGTEFNDVVLFAP